MNKSFLSLLIIALFLNQSCRRHPSIEVKDTPYRQYKTKKVVLVSIDGPRWSETWGDKNRQYIPHRSIHLLPQGVLLANFTNMGYTYTSSGHTAMLTGVYQPIDNGGRERPAEPNIFQYLLNKAGLPRDKTWIISSKDKIAALADCNNPLWAGKFIPETDCGMNGLGSGYREDSITFSRALEVLHTDKPTLTLIHFREPDYSGHSGDWGRYIQGIRSTDEYAWQLWNYLQTDSAYAGVTTMIITNDHGRHLDSVNDGFVSHGDNCWGCRHIELLAIGPDFKHNTEVPTPYELRDIPSTIGELLHTKTPQAEGVVMWDLFK